MANKLPQKLKLILSFFTCFALSLLGISCGLPAASYGTKVAYSPEKEIAFPDFTLTFLKKESQGNGTLPLGPVYSFRTASKSENKIVKWSSGTGDIGPALFEMAGQCFILELKRSEKLPKIPKQFNNLAENELVISPAPELCRGDD